MSRIKLIGRNRVRTALGTTSLIAMAPTTALAVPSLRIRRSDRTDQPSRRAIFAFDKPISIMPRKRQRTPDKAGVAPGL